MLFTYFQSATSESPNSLASFIVGVFQICSYNSFRVNATTSDLLLSITPSRSSLGNKKSAEFFRKQEGCLQVNPLEQPGIQNRLSPRRKLP
jgi:hypothetical protein